MKTLVLANQKGGVGKSAVATLLVHYLARQGRRVLAIDLDHQGNLGEPLRRSGRCVVAEGTSDQAMTSMSPELAAGGFVLLGAGPALLTLERQHAQHTPFAQAFRAFLANAAPRFDACVVDTNPNPDIRLIAALASCDFVLSPVQLNQEALDGVSFLLTHPRVGLQRIKAVLNPRLAFLGLLPSMVESTPFQRANFALVAQKYAHLLIRLNGQVNGQGDQLASIPKRTVIAEAQASGEVLWEMKKTAAREAWKEIEPTLACVAEAMGVLAERPPRTTPADASTVSVAAVGGA
jgi:chromosome partitioning protein